MALPRIFAALFASVMLASTSVGATEVEEIRLQFQQGDLAGALGSADRYLAQNPQDPQVRFIKGLILADQGKPDEAIGIFGALTEDYPELPEPYNNLAVIHAAHGRYQAAMHALEMAIRAHPGYATAYENLGDIHARMASEAYEKALTLDAGNAAAQAKLKLMRTLLEDQMLKSVATQSIGVEPQTAPGPSWAEER